MNLILLGSVAATVGGLGGPFLYYFYPASSGGGGGALVAKDENGDDVTFKGWLDTHQPGERKLVQGLKGDATYLIVKEDKTIENYGLVAVCTHLGCVVPWNKVGRGGGCWRFMRPAILRNARLTIFFPVVRVGGEQVYVPVPW